MFVRRWVIVASAALAIGAVVSDQVDGSLRLVPWRQSDPARLALIIPIFLALIAIATTRVRHPVVQGAVLTLATLAALAGYIGAVAVSERFLGPFVLLIQIIMGSSLVAASNHVLRRHWERGALRILSAVGGVGLLLSFLLKTQPYEPPLLWEMVDEGLFGRALAEAFFAALVLGFGILGVLNAIANPPAPLHRRLVSLFGNLLLALFPIALLFPSSLDSTHDPLLAPALLRFWLLATGHTVLLATGIATWAEALTDPRLPETEIRDIL